MNKLLQVTSACLALLCILAFSSQASATEYGPYGPFKDLFYALSKKNFAFSYQDANGQSYVQIRDGKPLGPYQASGLYSAVTALRVTDDGGYGFIYSQLEGGKARLYANINGTSIALRDRYNPRQPKLAMENKDKWLATTDQIAFVKFNSTQVTESACSPSVNEPCMIQDMGISENLWGYAYESFHTYKGYIKVFDRNRGNAEKIYGPYDFDGREEDSSRRANLAIGRRDWLGSYHLGGKGYVLINGAITGPFSSVNYIYAKDDVAFYCYTDLDNKAKCNIGGKVYEDFGSAGNFQVVADGNNWGVRSGGQCIITMNTTVLRTDCDRLTLSDNSYSLARSSDPSRYIINGEEFSVSPVGSRLNFDPASGNGPVWAGGRNWAYVAFPAGTTASNYCANITINNLNYNTIKVSGRQDMTACQANLSLTGTSYALRLTSGNDIWFRAGLNFINSAPAGSANKATCGNMKREGLEECDTIDFGGKTCASKQFYGGRLKCNASCKLDYSDCVGNSVCTDNDGGSNPFLQGATNLRVSGTGKTLVAGGYTYYRDQCLSATKLKEYYCVPDSQYPGLIVASREYDCKCSGGVCTDNKPACNRNGKVNAGEACDRTDLAKQTCQSLGFTGGSLSCGNDCQFNTSACFKCGDNKIDKGEKCDGRDLALNSCESLGFMCGELRCSDTCGGFDTSMCKTNKANCSTTQPGVTLFNSTSANSALQALVTGR